MHTGYVLLSSGFMGTVQEFLKPATFCDAQDSKAQVTALQLIIGTLQRTRVFGVENRDTLTHKATGVRHSALLHVSAVRRDR